MADRWRAARVAALLLCGLPLVACISTAPATDATVGASSGVGTPRPAPGQQDVILATTTSTQDSGLLDALLPIFERQTGYRVKTIAVGTGQALALGARGEADVLLVHAPEAERRWMAQGYGATRKRVMYNDFVLVGPAEDPAKVRGERSAETALRKIAAARALVTSRGDESGTHQQEQALWKAAGIAPRGQPWYLETGQGMGATLNVANEKRAYTLSDRGTFLARQPTLQLEILVSGTSSLRNVYHVITVKPERYPRLNVDGGHAFATFIISPEAQAAIASLGVSQFGQPLFFPDAGGDED